LIYAIIKNIFPYFSFLNFLKLNPNIFTIIFYLFLSILTCLLIITIFFFLFFIFFSKLNKHLVTFHFYFSLYRENINHFDSLSRYLIKSYFIIWFKYILIVVKPLLKWVHSSLSHIFPDSTVWKKIGWKTLFSSFWKHFTYCLSILWRSFWILYLYSTWNAFILLITILNRI
jgi:hypothetical protein